MRTLLTLAALGNSAWAPVNYLQKPFLVSLGASITSGASLTYKVQHTFDNPQLPRGVLSLVRSGTVVTVNDVDHRLSVGDSLNVMNTGDANLDGSNLEVATVVDADNYTYNVSNTGILVPAAPWNVRLVSLRVYDHPLMTALVARADGNYAFPVQACRLKTTVYASGKVDLEVTQGNR
jgi:hypothetical protein